jgi:hypothetical protein
MTNKTYRVVPVTERNPTKFGMYICHVRIVENGLTYIPVSYCQFDTIRNDWTSQSVCGTNGEIVDWFELIE